MWWSKNPLLSHNAFLNMVLSNRGGGKTYGCTDWSVDSYKKKKKKTVWTRRYQTEIDEMLKNGKFFDAIRAKYPKDELTIEGNTGFINGEPFIYFVALSTSRQLKSNNFPDVDKIIFDEFIIEKGRVTYLKNEVEVFLDLCETVFRLRDDGRAVLLANSVTIVNPYFTFFGIKPDKSRRFTVKGQVCVELFTDTDFVQAKKKTRFGQLIQGTRYAGYAIENDWLLDNETFIQPKTPTAEFKLGLKYNGIMYGFWFDYSEGLIFVNTQYDPYSRRLYCLTREDHDVNLLLVKTINESKAMRMVVDCFRASQIRFQDMNVKNQFYEFIGLFVR